jgi:hypothetical protein
MADQVDAMLREQLKEHKEKLRKLVSASGASTEQSARQSDQLNKLSDQKKQDARRIGELKNKKAELASL